MCSLKWNKESFPREMHSVALFLFTSISSFHELRLMMTPCGECNNMSLNHCQTRGSIIRVGIIPGLPLNQRAF